MYTAYDVLDGLVFIILLYFLLVLLVNMEEKHMFVCSKIWETFKFQSRP